MGPFVTLVAVAATLAAAGRAHATHTPSVDVPGCPRVGSISYARSVPDRTAFPRTRVDLCYTDEHLQMGFTAYDEVDFYFNASHRTNDDIWAYEVMEAFIHRGTEDPQTYLEFEVSPNNVTYQAFVYNPSRVREPSAAFDHLFVSNPAADGFAATTELDRSKEIWRSHVSIPLALFNVKHGEARGTQWRMNFFRTVVGQETFPNQKLGAWIPPNKANFHITGFFGNVEFA